MKDKPAFPVTLTDRSGQVAPTEIGMTLREYAAIKAMQGLLSNSSVIGPDLFWSRDIESTAIWHADKLLEKLDEEAN